MVKRMPVGLSVPRRASAITAFFFICVLFACTASLSSCQTAARPVTSDPQIIVSTSLGMYRSIISTQDDSRCVFTPTCSRYMEEAINRHGLPGFFMGLDRLTRCHGLNLKKGTCYEILKDGTLYDPVK